MIDHRLDSIRAAQRHSGCLPPEPAQSAQPALTPPLGVEKADSWGCFVGHSGFPTGPSASANGPLPATRELEATPSPADFLENLRHRGVRVQLAGSRLVLEPRSALVPRDLEDIASHLREVVGSLRDEEDRGVGRAQALELEARSSSSVEQPLDSTRARAQADPEGFAQPWPTADRIVWLGDTGPRETGPCRSCSGARWWHLRELSTGQPGEGRCSRCYLPGPPADELEWTQAPEPAPALPAPECQVESVEDLPGPPMHPTACRRELTCQRLGVWRLRDVVHGQPGSWHCMRCRPPFSPRRIVEERDRRSFGAEQPREVARA